MMVLLAFEVLWVSLLFVAALLTLGLRRKSRIAAFFICAAGIGLPLILLGLLTAITGMVRFAANSALSGSTAFWWALGLLVCYIVGAFVIRYWAVRRDAAVIRRAFSWPLARIARSLLLMAFFTAFTLWNVNLQIKMEVQALRSEAGTIAFIVVPRPVPDSANAAPLYKQAQASFIASAADADKVAGGDALYGGLNAPSPAVTAYLQRHQKTLELLRRAADLPACRPDYDFLHPDMQAALDQLPQYRVGSNLLGTAAQTEAVTGNVELALDDCRRMYAVGGHAGSIPMIVSGMMTIAIDASASQTVAKVLPSVRTSAQLEHFVAPDPMVLTREFETALQGDEAYSLASICDLASGTYTNNSHNGSRIAGSAIWLMWLQADAAITRTNLHRFQQLASRPYYESIDELNRLKARAQPGPGNGLMSMILIPSMASTFPKMVAAQALRSGVDVAIAATRYRLDHGEYPATDDALAPAYLAAIPLDPFDGKPLRLKKSADGSLTIYSVGEDLIDNGGDVVRTDDKKATDVGVVLLTPAATSVGTRPAP